MKLSLRVADAYRFLSAGLFIGKRAVDKALGNIAEGGGGGAFQLPYEYVEKALGEKLSLWLPARAFDVMIAAWVVEHDGTVWNISRYFVGTGDWSAVAIDFRGFVEYLDMLALVEYGNAFRQSEQYRFHIDRIEKNTPTVTNDVPLATVEDVDDYFGRYLRLVKGIREHGMLRQRELEKMPDFDPHSRLGRLIRVRRGRDISVAIGPKGEIWLLQRAYHRSAAAMALDLPRVPVEVRLIHRDWLRAMVREYPDRTPGDAVVMGLRAIEERFNSSTTVVCRSLP